MDRIRKASIHSSYIKPIISNVLLQNFINSGLASSKNSIKLSVDRNLKNKQK